MARQPRIARPSIQHARKPRPDMDRKHLDRVKGLPCIVCGDPYHTDPHHLMRLLAEDTGKRGLSLTSADRWTVPVCRRDH